MARNYIATRNIESQQPFRSLQDAVAHMIPNPRAFSTNQPLAAGSHHQSLVTNDWQTQNRSVSEGQPLHVGDDTEVRQSSRRNKLHRHQHFENINIQRQQHSTEGYERIRNELVENVIISGTDNDLQTDSIENQANNDDLALLHLYNNFMLDSHHLLAGSRIRSPQYQTFNNRLRTFTNWPDHLTQKPRELAQAGFYSLGKDDVVRCFACDGGLKNWEPEDDPWIKHAHWFSGCDYLRHIKGDEFIRLVRIMDKDTEIEDEPNSSNDNEETSYIQALNLNDCHGVQSVHKRELDFLADVYTLSSSCFPRVQILRQQCNSISERFNKQNDCYNTLMQNVQQNFPTRVSVHTLRKDPEILVTGDLRTKLALRNIVWYTDQLRDDLPLKTISLSKYYQLEDPCLVVFTARIFTDNDILICLGDLNHLLDGPYQHVLVVIEADRQSEHFESLKSMITGHVQQHKKQRTKVQICIPCDWLEKQEVSEKISECFELMIVSLLSSVEEGLRKNIKQGNENTERKIICKALEKSLRSQEKLYFEVASLLKRTVAKDKFGCLLPPVELPSSDLFEIGEVQGYGILYNKLHIHIKLKNPEDEEKVCEQIKAKLFHYGYPYEISVIVKKAVPLYCVGETLHAVCNNIKLGYGTVGAFMYDRAGNLHILTCRHVVNLVCGRADHLCFIDTNNQVQIGTAIYVPPYSVEDTQMNFLDIAAVEVEVNQKARCNVDFRRPDGTTGPSNLFSRSFSDIAGQSVYKWGAATGMTRGIIASTDYRRRDSLQFPNLNVLIEPEPGAEGVFAEEGDSGATVCTLELDNTISVIAMVTAGRYTPRDGTGETEAVFALHFREGIRHLNSLLPNPINI